MKPADDEGGSRYFISPNRSRAVFIRDIDHLHAVPPGRDVGKIARDLYLVAHPQGIYHPKRIRVPSIGDIHDAESYRGSHVGIVTVDKDIVSGRPRERANLLWKLRIPDVDDAQAAVGRDVGMVATHKDAVWVACWRHDAHQLKLWWHGDVEDAQVSVEASLPRVVRVVDGVQGVSRHVQIVHMGGQWVAVALVIGISTIICVILGHGWETMVECGQAADWRTCIARRYAMPYELRRELRDGQVCRLSIGLDPVDDYLDFLRCRCRPNTWLNYAHDLKIFFNTVDKPVTAVSTADVFRFIRCQSQGPADPVGDASSEGVSTRTIKRRLCAVSGLYKYLLMDDDPPIKRNPVPSGFVLRGQIPTSRPRLNPLLRVPETLPQLVPVEQVQRFLASLNTYRDKAMVLLMALGGLRKSEVTVRVNN